jgi:predicted nicotinamide N-methyase
VKQRFEEDFEFEGLKLKQTLETEPPSCVYDTAIVLAKYLSQNNDMEMAKSTILELGAGTGFTGIYLSKLGIIDRAILTDVSNVIPLLQQNIEANGCETRVQQGASLHWASQSDLDTVIDLADRRIDFIVGGDIVFDFEHFDGLHNLLVQVFERCETKKAFIAFTKRFSDIETWFQEGLIEHGFRIEEATDAPKEWSLENVTILIVSR